MAGRDEGNAYDVFVARAGVELRHKGFEDKDAGEDGDEDSGEDEDDGQAGDHAQFVFPPREAVDVPRAALFYTERATGTEPQRENAFAYPPPFDKYDRPEDNEDGVYRGVRCTEEEEEDAEDGGKDEGLRVCVQERKVHGHSIAKLFAQAFLFDRNEAACSPSVYPSFIEFTVVQGHN